MRAIASQRVSIDKQADSGLSLDDQAAWPPLSPLTSTPEQYRPPAVAGGIPRPLPMSPDLSPSTR